MRKGQTEILGIALVVVVLVFVGMIFLSISLRQPKTSPATSLKRSLQRDIMGNYYPLAMLKTTTPCGYSLEELLKNYVSSDSIKCDGAPVDETYFNKEIPKMLEFLNDSGYCYQLNIGNLLQYSNPNSPSCSQTTQSQTYSETLPLMSGDTLKIGFTILS